jgi:tetratricopeptide (TPR) repeat protein
MFEALDSEFKAVSRVKRLFLCDHEFSCVVIHGDDIFSIFDKSINIIYKHLHQMGIRVNVLPEKVKQYGSYEQQFEQLVDNCIFVIGLEEGFKKNLSYEYGYLRGIRKPIIVINSSNNPMPSEATHDGDNDENNQFARKELLNKFIYNIDFGSESQHELQDAIIHKFDQILSEIMEGSLIDSDKIGDGNQEAQFNDIKYLIRRTIDYYVLRNEYGLHEIEEIFESIDDLDANQLKNLPPFALKCLLALSINLLKSLNEKNQVHDMAEKCIFMCEKILDIEKDSALKAVIEKKLADLLLISPDPDDEVGNLERAIDLYKKSKVYLTLDEYPDYLVSINNNLGVALNDLFQIVGESKYLNEANDYLSNLVGDQISSNSNFALVKYNLGITRLGLARVVSAQYDYKEALECFNSFLMDPFYLDNIEDFLDNTINIGSMYFKIAKEQNDQACCERSIGIFQNVLGLCSTQIHGIEYGIINQCLGDAYSLLDTIKPDNIETKLNIIGNYKEALKIYTPDKFPDEFCCISFKLADALSTLRRRHDLESATEIFNQLLSTPVLESYNYNHALIHKKLAILYSRLADMDMSRDYHSMAIESYEGALSQFSSMKDEYEIADLKMYLGDVYFLDAKQKIDSTLYIKATEAYQDALSYFTRDKFPLIFASLKMKLGDVYGMIAEDQNSIDYCNEAIRAYEESLNIYNSYECHKESWEVHKKISDTYITLGDIKSDSHYPDDAVNYYTEALKFLTNQSSPIEKGKVLRKLGNEYVQLSRIVYRTQNLKSALEYYEKALMYYNPDEFPSEHEEIRMNIGTILRISAVLEKESGNLIDAISFYERAAEFISINSNPNKYASLMVAIGSIYKQLSHIENQVDNNKKAIEYYNNALVVYNPQDHPLEHGSLQKDLGLAYIEIAEKENEIENIMNANRAFEASHKIYSVEDNPEDLLFVESKLSELSRKISNRGNGTSNQTSLQDASYDNSITPQPVNATLNNQEVIEQIMTLDQPAAVDNTDTDREGSKEVSVESDGFGPLNLEINFTKNELNDASDSIEHLDQLISETSPVESPKLHAYLNYKIGNAYQNIGKSNDSSQNYKEAIRYYVQALKYYTYEEYPYEYACINGELATSYKFLGDLTGDLKDYEIAVELYNDSLGVIKINEHPAEFGNYHLNMGLIFSELGNILQLKAHYDNAIQSYQQALQVFESSEYPSEYSLIQKKLGSAYSMLADHESYSHNCQKSAEAYKQALTVYEFENFPNEFAEIHKKLGILYLNSGLNDQDTNNFLLSVKSFEEALKLYNLENYPADYGLIKIKEAMSYEYLSKACQESFYLRQSIDAYKEAIKYYTHEIFPDVFASIALSLGNVYQNLGKLENTDIDKRIAIEYYKQALMVYNSIEFPLEYATTEYNLGRAYLMLADSEQIKDNVIKAINSFKASSKVYSKIGLSDQYGSCENNLGIAYMKIANERESSAYLALARESLEKAIKVMTCEKQPIEFADTQYHLGDLFMTLYKNENKIEYAERSIQAYEKALQIYTEDRFPAEYNTIQNNVSLMNQTLAIEKDESKLHDDGSWAYLRKSTPKSLN